MTHSIQVQSTHTKTQQSAASLKTQAGSPKPDILKGYVLCARISPYSPFNVVVDDEDINDEVFQKEKVKWQLIEVDDFLEDLLDWIGEQPRNSVNRTLMMQDLFMLNAWEYRYIWSSIETNLYVAPSLQPERFNEICQEVLKANRTH
ncbi:hypothetical protein [Shewanella colwelliana]|uniref:hypothetical protein n=1 Tax=Shewanella colwelliana TaxID=23 RepID=UPI0037351E85